MTRRTSKGRYKTVKYKGHYGHKQSRFYDTKKKQFVSKRIVKSYAKEKPISKKRYAKYVFNPKTGSYKNATTGKFVRDTVAEKYFDKLIKAEQIDKIPTKKTRIKKVRPAIKGTRQRKKAGIGEDDLETSIQFKFKVEGYGNRDTQFTLSHRHNVHAFLGSKADVDKYIEENYDEILRDFQGFNTKGRNVFGDAEVYMTSYSAETKFAEQYRR